MKEHYKIPPRKGKELKKRVQDFPFFHTRSQRLLRKEASNLVEVDKGTWRIWKEDYALVIPFPFIFSPQMNL